MIRIIDIIIIIIIIKAKLSSNTTDNNRIDINCAGHIVSQIDSHNSKINDNNCIDGSCKENAILID